MSGRVTFRLPDESVVEAALDPAVEVSGLGAVVRGSSEAVEREDEVLEITDLDP